MSMEIIETITPRASVVNDNGQICARIERSSFLIEKIHCRTVESARKIARARGWEVMIYDWQKKAHACVVEIEKEACDSCTYRNTRGCLSDACPVHRLLDCINKAPALIKRTVKKLENEKEV